MDNNQGHIAFDVLECVKRLRDEAGFSQKQAEVQAEQIQIVKADLETHLTTKRDLEEMGYKITIWLGGIVVASAMFVLGVIFTMGKMGVFKSSPTF